MVLVNKILNILNSMEDVATVMYETGYSANLRIDRKPSPYAILYLVQGADLDLSNNLKESCEVEVYFCKENKLDADGLTTQAVIDDMMVLAKQFISIINTDKSVRIDDNIHIQNAYGRFDKHTAGVSVQFTISDRQAHCIDYEEPSIRTLTITENGEYDTTQYGKVIVNINQ